MALTIKQREQLSNAIQYESDQLPEYSTFGDSNHKEQTPVAIEYLHNRTLPDVVPEVWEVVYGLIDDEAGMYEMYKSIYPQFFTE